LAGLKDAEAAYKKAEERAKIADAVTTELNNKLLEVQNNLEADKITGKHDLEVAKAKETAQKELDAAKQEAALALAGYEKALKEAQIKARVGLAQLLAEGIGAEGADGELKTLLDTYNYGLETLEEKVTALKDALKALDDSDEETLTAQVEEKANALALAQKNKTDFEALVTRASAADYQTKWEELQKTIDNIAPRTNKLNYEIQEFKNKIDQENDKIEKDLDDYKSKTSTYSVTVTNTVLKDYVKEYVEKYSGEEPLSFDYDDETGVISIAETANKDLEDKLEDLKSVIEKKASTLASEVEILKGYADKGDKTKLAGTETTVEDIEKDETGLIAKFIKAAGDYSDDHSDANKNKWVNASSALLGVPPEFLKLEAYLTLPDEKTVAQHNATTDVEEEQLDLYESFGLYSAYLKYKKDKDNQSETEASFTAAQKIVKDINDKIKAYNDKVEELLKAQETAKAAEDYKKLLSDKAAKETEKEGLETEQGYAESLQGIIAAFTGFGDGFEFDDQEGEDGTFTVGEDYTEKYNAAIKILDKDIAKATKDKEKADANLAAYQAAVKAGQTGDFEAVDTNVSDDLADLGEKIQAIIDAQEELKTQQKAVDKAKAAYDTKVEYYKEKTN
jgi:hypothetical protein